MAIRYSQLKVVRELLENGVDVEVQDEVRERFGCLMGLV